MCLFCHINEYVHQRRVYYSCYKFQQNLPILLHNDYYLISFFV